VEPSGLEKAEQECFEDAGERAKARAAGAVRRQEQDRELIARMTLEIAKLFPRCLRTRAKASVAVAVTVPPGKSATDARCAARASMMFRKISLIRVR
jgi:hypothetical protein